MGLKQANKETYIGRNSQVFNNNQILLLLRKFKSLSKNTKSRSKLQREGRKKENKLSSKTQTHG